MFSKIFGFLRIFEKCHYLSNFAKNLVNSIFSKIFGLFRMFSRIFGEIHCLTSIIVDFCKNFEFPGEFTIIQVSL